ncbi:nose resistant to fluoxetine protein 6-like [Diaphorina citri]|uniref:Nose resistant to fluoxetine protein 6-like n=1 Tax=Diaphorina citri TaxID=121845 RepID=A0A1S3DTW5_DIACI|nr:nose resistant to fluoxetine protein 6-like [Diaphorina citri]
MKFPLYPLIVFKLFIFIRCETKNITDVTKNVTYSKSIEKAVPKYKTNVLPTKLPDVKVSPQNKTVFLKSVKLSEDDFEATLNDTLEDIDPVITDKSKEFDWKDPQFQTFKFDYKKDNSSLEKLLSILTPLINITRLDNDTNAFDWSDEELDSDLVDQDLLSGEDEDLGSLNLEVGTFIQKINPISKPKSLDQQNQAAKKDTPKTPTNLKPKSSKSDQTLDLKSETLQANSSGETVASSSDVVNVYSNEDNDELMGEPSTIITYRIPREAGDLYKRAPNTPPEPFISRRFNVNSLKELMDFYEPERLPGLEELNISAPCKKDMALYIEALNSRIPWALKMFDASGHYGGSFYNGNTYWLGSSSLCARISKHPSRVPFKLGFFTARADFEFASIEPKERRQFIGVCLPYSCLQQDVTQILQHSSEEGAASSERSVAISHVRPPHSYYNMARDPLVWSLGIVTLIVAILLAAGTCLDLYLSRQDECDLNKKEKKMYDNYNYAISNAGLPSNEMKLDVSGHDSPAGTVLETGEIKVNDLLTEMLLSFSVIRNMKQICDQSVGVDTIPTVHGFRALSMAWVVLGHTCIIAFKYADNMEYRIVVQEEFIFQVVNNATFSVDTFFFISGLLVSFLYFRTIAKIDVHRLTKVTGFASGCLEFVGLVGYRFFSTDDPLTLFDQIYDKPWTRLGPYLIGISVGWILYKTDCSIKMNKLTVITGWFLSIFLLLGMVFGVYGSSLHPLTAAAYSALSHSLWALALAFIVIACSTGYGGFVNSLLSAKCLYPFSRVTYCAYLVHPIVMRSMVMTRDSPMHLGKDIVITLFIGQLVTSYLISFLVSLAFEAPIVTMLKIISPTKRRHRLQ